MLNIIPTVTTKKAIKHTQLEYTQYTQNIHKKAIKYTQLEIRKEYKYTTLNTKKDRNAGNGEQKAIRHNRKQSHKDKSEAMPP